MMLGFSVEQSEKSKRWIVIRVDGDFGCHLGSWRTLRNALKFARQRLKPGMELKVYPA